MVSLVINSPSLWCRANYTADVRWQPPARETRHPARADSDEPDASRADAQAVGRPSGIGVEHEAEQAQTGAEPAVDRRSSGLHPTVWSADRRPVVRSQPGLGKNVPRPDVPRDAFVPLRLWESKRHILLVTTYSEPSEIKTIFR